MLEPFKFVGRLVVCEKDAEGNIIAEHQAAEIVLYASQLNQLSERVSEVMPHIQAKFDEAKR